MVKARKYIVKNHFVGLPKREDYEIAEEELPPLQNGEILVKTEWVCVDPYLRSYNSHFPVPYNQFAFQVGMVQDSKDPEFPIGTRVVSHEGWCDYYISNSDKIKQLFEKLYKLPNCMPGVSAYFGFLEICHPKAGETVVVSGAAGAVGSLVGQIAKIKGCKVIGFAGSDEKAEWLEEIGFDKAFNYKTVDITTSLKEAAPDGVDIYSDNVGGEISSLIIGQMRDFGRVSVCGSISTYNEDPTKMSKATVIQPSLVFHQLKVEGFSIWRWLDRWSEGFAEIIKWINAGELKVREHITEGFDNIFYAFFGMLNGENVGKAIVKI